MSATTVTLIVVGLIIVVAVIAWLLYKANFKAKEITIKAGIVEAKMGRETGSEQKTKTPKPRTEAAQEAIAGGRIKDSTIKAPAESGARLKQKAEDDGSSITGSHIELS